MAEQPQKPLQTINVKNRPNCNGLKKIPLISLPLWVKKIEHNLFCKFSRWIRPHPWPTLLTELIDPYFDQFYRWIGPIWGKSLWDHLFVGLFTVFRCWIYVLKLACLGVFFWIKQRQSKQRYFLFLLDPRLLRNVYKRLCVENFDYGNEILSKSHLWFM